MVPRQVGDPGSPVYNIPVVVRLTGELNLGVLTEQSLTEILRRHEALRTTFAEEQGQAVQRIAAEARLELTVVNMEHLPEEERRVEAERGSSRSPDNHLI